jgi:hypothetical protein
MPNPVLDLTPKPLMEKSTEIVVSDELDLINQIKQEKSTGAVEPVKQEEASDSSLALEILKAENKKVVANQGVSEKQSLKNLVDGLDDEAEKPKTNDDDLVLLPEFSTDNEEDP